MASIDLGRPGGLGVANPPLLPGISWNFQWEGKTASSPYVGAFTDNAFQGAHSSDRFTVMHLNVRGLDTNFDNLKLLLQNLNESNVVIDAILLCETFLQESNCRLFQLKGYKFFELHRGSMKQGGVGIYISEDYQYKLRGDLSIFDQGQLESIFCEVTVGRKKYIIGEIYHPPRFNDLDFLTKLEPLLDKIFRLKKNTIIGTDQNIDFLKLAQAGAPSDMLHLTTSNGLIPVIVKPTRVTDHSSTLIDNIYVTSGLFVDSLANVIVNNISDHFPCLMSLPIDGHKAAPLEFCYRKTNEVSFEQIKENLVNIDWQTLCDQNTSSAFEGFIDTVQTAYFESCPMRTVKIRPRKIIREKWMTASLLNKSANLQEHYKRVCRLNRQSDDFKDYIRKRNDFNKAKRNQKQSYFSDLLSNHKNDSKQLWKIVNSLSGRDKTESMPPSFVKDGLTVSCKKEIVDNFNEFFANVGPRTCAGIPSVPESFEDYLRKTPNCQQSMWLNPVDPAEVREMIHNLKNSSSCGTDQLTTRLVKALKETIAEPLAILINKSFLEGVFPDVFKISKITPIYKKGDKCQFDNYRPIALLSVVSKVVETAVHKRLQSFLHTTNFFSNNQYGFRSNHSTIDAVAQLTGTILNGFNKSKSTVAVLLDISKAFDTIDHRILLRKLEHSGVRGLSQAWFQSYLSDREQMVALNGEVSDPRGVTSGIPQGSILGPLIFSIYVNDIHTCILNSQVLQFADDTTLHLTGDLEEIIPKLNVDLNSLVRWFFANRLALSTSKTTAIAFSKRNFVIPPDLPEIKVWDEVVPFEPAVKLLGIYLDSDLSWKTHSLHVRNKISSSLYAINKCKNLLNTQTLKLMYYGLVHPYLTYGISLWGAGSQSEMKKILIIQKKSLRAVFHKPTGAHTDPLFKAGEILKVSDLHRLECLKLLFRYKQGNLPSNLRCFFRMNCEVHSYNTRQASQAHIFPVHFENYKRGFIYRAVVAWNSIPCAYRGVALWSTLANWFKRECVSSYN